MNALAFVLEADLLAYRTNDSIVTSERLWMRHDLLKVTTEWLTIVVETTIQWLRSRLASQDKL
jgi:hypothetical protein